MRSTYKKWIVSCMMLVVFITSCTQNDHPLPTKEARLNLFFRTSRANDALVKGGDGSFSSLALYIFNKADGYCEYSELMPFFTPEAVQEFSRSVNISPQTKMIYAIANYNDPDKTFSLPITEALTMQQIENLTVNTTNISDTSILMIGRQEIIIDSEYVTAEVPMERLVARLDIYMFKNRELTEDNIVVTSIQLKNQILNSNCTYQDNSMETPVTKQDVTTAITSGGTLEIMPADAGIIPVNAHTSYYTYQNIVTSVSSEDTPYLRITALFNGVSHVYRAYITDNGQTSNKYSLMRNTVYTVIAMLDHPDNELILKTIPLPWDVTETEIGHEVKDTDFSLDPYGGDDAGASTGVVYYPYIDDAGNAQNATTFANYSFKMTGPSGAIWTATLTNGLDFAFGTGNSLSGNILVSSGISRDEAYEINIGATKSWAGASRSTYMYITVEGVKLRINPLQEDNTRKFPGNNDTDILIVQTAYQ